MTMVAEASRLAYRELRLQSENGLRDRQQRVLACLVRYPGMSSSEIARTLTREHDLLGTGYRMSSRDVCSRICELRRAGLVVVTGTKTDRFTGRRVRQYEAVPRDTDQAAVL
jgi:hypothetical protein